MADNSQIDRLVLRAVQALNQQLPTETQVPVALDTPLFGEGGPVDSLGLVNLILWLEETIAAEWGVEVTLSDDRAFSPASPFRNGRLLADHVNSLIAAKARPAE